MLKLCLVFLYPAIEIYLLVKLGSLIGAFPTVCWVFASAGLGFWLIKVRCKTKAENIAGNLVSGVVEKRAIMDNILFFIAGILLILPGLVTDVFGLLLLIPFVRTLLLSKAGNALFRYSQSPGFSSATRLFVYDNTTGQYYSAQQTYCQSNTETDLHRVEAHSASQAEHVVLDVESTDITPNDNNGSHPSK